MKKLAFMLATLCIGATSAAHAVLPVKPSGSPWKLPLSEGWHIQSTAKVNEDGSKLSQSGFVAKDWYSTIIPSTVVAALVKNPYGESLFPVALTPGLYLGASAVALLTGLASAWYPARHAARLDPATVIRHG